MGFICHLYGIYMHWRYSTAASQGQTLREAAGGAGQCSGAEGSIWAAAGKIMRAIVARGLRAVASRRSQVVRASDYLRLAISWQRSMAYHGNTDEPRAPKLASGCGFRNPSTLRSAAIGDGQHGRFGNLRHRAPRQHQRWLDRPGIVADWVWLRGAARGVARCATH